MGKQTKGRHCYDVNVVFSFHFHVCMFPNVHCCFKYGSFAPKGCYFPLLSSTKTVLSSLVLNLNPRTRDR